MKKKYSVSAILPVHNSGAYIEQTIQGLLQQSLPFDEIVIVDGKSTDNTPEIVKKYKKIKFIRLGYDPERIVKRNIAWKASKGNVIAFIDSDLFLVKDWLKEVMHGINKGHVAVVDRRAVYQPKTYIAKMNDHFFDLRFTDAYKPFTAWVVLRDVLEKLGGLDESAIGFEDINLGNSLYAAGYDIYFAKNAVAYHKGEPTSFLAEMRRHFWFGSHALPYWKKRVPKGKMFKVAVFSLLTLLFFIRPFWSLGVFSLAYLYVFFKDLFYWKMHFKYLFVHPFIAVASEFTYAWGLVYSLFRGPMTYARSSDAAAAKEVSTS